MRKLRSECGQCIVLLLPGEQVLCHSAEGLLPSLCINNLQPAFFVDRLILSLKVSNVCEWDCVAGQVVTLKNTLGGVAQKMAERLHAIKRAVDCLQLRPYLLALARIWPGMPHGPCLSCQRPCCQCGQRFVVEEIHTTKEVMQAKTEHVQIIDVRAVRKISHQLSQYDCQSTCRGQAGSISRFLLAEHEPAFIGKLLRLRRCFG